MRRTAYGHGYWQLLGLRTSLLEKESTPGHNTLSFQTRSALSRASIHREL